ncbi:similar to An15g01150 [Aspergillus luchuensis]|nr:similar to An15g01150 [Aspergillus luchuensis]
MAGVVPSGALESQGLYQSLMQEHNRHDPSNRGPVVRFVKPLYDKESGAVSDFEEHDKQPKYREVADEQIIKMLKVARFDTQPMSKCLLYRLPLEVRLRIWECLFPHNWSAVELEEFAQTTTGLAILLTSHQIFHEALLVFFYSLAYSRLVLKEYGGSTAHYLKSVPLKLDRCIYKRRGFICLDIECDEEREFGSLVLSLGDKIHETAVRRRWGFALFITTLRMEGPLRVHDLTVAVTENWKIPGFDENDLVQALFSGAFTVLGRLKFVGFTRMERRRLTNLILARQDPCVQLMRRRDDAEDIVG